MMKYLVLAMAIMILSYISNAEYDQRDPDSWELGKPDNLTKTEVIIMGDSSCECP